MKSMNLKLMTAAAGAGALLAMGGITVATSSAEPAEPGPVEQSEITTGETTTEAPLTTTTAPESPSTESAAPEITGPAELPPEEQGLPG